MSAFPDDGDKLAVLAYHKLAVLRAMSEGGWLLSVEQIKSTLAGTKLHSA
jgi:hypothetical protein